MRLVPIVAPIALVASLCTPVRAASPPPHPMPVRGAIQKCPPGEYMVKGHTHNGKAINLYCMTNVSHKKAVAPGGHNTGASPEPHSTR